MNARNRRKNFLSPICLFLFLISLAYPAASQDSETTDAALSAAIAGCWAGKEGPTNGVTVEGVTCYEPTGTAEMRAELTGEGIEVTINVKGTWKIAARKLMMVVTETTVPEVLPPGHTSADDIVSISSDRMVLLSEDGTKSIQTRVEGFKKNGQRTEVLRQPTSGLRSSFYGCAGNREQCALNAFGTHP